MKKLLLTTLLACTACAGNNPLQPIQTITGPTQVSTLVSNTAPSTEQNTLARIQSFQSDFAQIATTPRGGVDCLVRALLEPDPELRKRFLTLVLIPEQLIEDSSSPTGYRLDTPELATLFQLNTKPQIIRSYLGGTTEKGYTDFNPAAPLNFPPNGALIGGVFVDNSAEAEGATRGKVYIQSNGKEAPTPITLQQDANGLWKIDKISLASIATDVK